MQFSVLGSGSRGNCVFIESGSTAILIDGGFSGKEIALRLAAIGRTIDCLEGIFVTHEHHDHINGVGVMSRRCSLPVFANEGTFTGAEKRLKKLFRRQEFNTGDTLDFQDLSIRSFAVSHDTNDPVGFIVSDDRRSLGYCTDTGIVSTLVGKRLQGLDSLVLEFNHDPELLRNGPYPPSLQQRVRSNQGHLANEDSAKLLEKIVHEKLQHVILAHLSETNNLPEIAYREAERVIPETSSREILKISDQDQPTALFKIT